MSLEQDATHRPDHVRLARTSDVDDIARVQVSAWRVSYAGVLPAALLDALDSSDIALEWGRALLTATEDRLFVAVNAEGEVVGAAAAGACPDADLRSVTGPAGEIGLVVVDPQHRGRGHGSRLLAAVVEHLQARGCHTAACWIPLADEPLRAFFSSAGFGPDSAYRDRDMGDALLREVRLVSDITGG